MIRRKNFIFIFMFIGLIGLHVPNLTWAQWNEGSESKAEIEATLTKLVMQRVRRSHVSPKLLNNKYSKDVFDTFIKARDYNKQFFLKSDIEAFDKYKYLLDDEMITLTFDFMNEVESRIDKNMSKVEDHIQTILDQPFDFSLDETIEFDGEKRKYVKTDDALKQRWKKTLKYQSLLNYMDLYREKINKENSETSKNVNIYEKDIEILSELEQQSRDKTKKSINQMIDRMKKETAEETFSVFLNALTVVHDPHTSYFLPDRKKDFDINIRGSLEGIGAVLREEDGMIQVVKIIRGSAAWKQGKLKANDKIMKVAQGKDEPVDIIGMRVKDAVKLIRGQKGTEVRLTVKHENGSVEIIPIVRDVVRIEETYAKSCVIENTNTNHKVGYISLPSFYRNFDNPRDRNAAGDLKKEIRKLKVEEVQGLILDLRNNSGGALLDAIQIVGQFIPLGPVVQIKNRTTKKIKYDRDRSIEYDGPLVVLINRNSASASEIVAAALQDYNRAILVGSDSTHGKGTVQTFYNMDNEDRFIQNEIKPLGSLKLTIQKYYRINGISTQYQGVRPDIILPDTFLSGGERDQDFSLKGDRVEATSFQRWPKVYPIDNLRKKSESRVLSNDVFNKIINRRIQLMSQKNDTLRSLNMKKIWEKQGLLKKEQNEFESIFKEVPHFTISAPYLEKLEFNDKKQKTEWQKQLKKDVYIEEAVYILSDMLVLEQST